MITKNIEDINTYATLSSSFKYDKLKPHLARAKRNEVVSIIGAEQYAALEDYSDADVVIKSAIDLIKDAEVNIALYYYLPVGSIQITAGGVSVIVPKGQIDATPKDTRDAMRYHKKSGHQALDNLLLLMEQNEAKFTDWKASKQYTKFKGLLINTTSDFQEYYNIFNSRQTFLSLLPDLKTAEIQHITPVITKAVLTELKTSNSDNEIFKEVKELVKNATVLFVVSKTLGNGQYYQQSTGFELRFDILDYERNFTSSQQLSKTIVEQKRTRENEAEELLKSAKKLMVASPEVFLSYVAPVVTETSHFYNGNGFVGI